VRTRLVALDEPKALRARLFKHHTEVHLKRVDERLLAAARELEFVDAVQPVGNTLLVALEDPDQHNPALIRRLVEAGADVRYVTPQEHSLEDVYLKLIEEASQT
jgi:ABC-2 type transport system ATP-binding protein